MAKRMYGLSVEGIEKLREKFPTFGKFMEYQYAKYLAEQVSKGRPAPSRADFAKYLNITPQTLSSYINDLRNPSEDALDVISAKVGLEAYFVCGKSPRVPADPILSMFVYLFPGLKQVQRAALQDMLLNFVDDNEQSSKSDTISPILTQE